MTTSKETASNDRRSAFILEGDLSLQESECSHQEENLDLQVFAFDKLGTPLGGSAPDAKGHFKLSLNLREPADIELMVGPGEDAASVHQSSAFLQAFSAKEWTKGETGFVINPKIVLPPSIWWPWRPVRFCVTGHVRKIDRQPGHTHICPVPFVKVEVFDVDREACWWLPIRNWWDLLLDRPVVRIPDLLKPRFPPRPFPGPDPFPDLQLGRRMSDMAGAFAPGSEASLNPQPLPPHEIGGQMQMQSAFEAMQTSSPGPQATLQQQSLPDRGRVGEARTMDASIAARLDRLTLTSKIAPWVLFPRCFYSRKLVCESYTDCNGAFRCCFRWSPLQVRNGRLRYDAKPDIIVRITQVINGVSRVIYMDPYTSTRWNQGNAHIDLYLDNEEVRCGRGCHPVPEGAQVFFTRIGNDEVYQIHQGTGLFADASYSQMAYGSNLDVFAQFGDALATGAPKRYYRLSYAIQGSADADFKFIDTDLKDTCVDKVTLTSSDHFLGPQPVNGTTTLYEVRNRDDYYWYNPDWIGRWLTGSVEENTGLYDLRLELFDENGVYLNTASGQVDYRNGAVVPPAVLPQLTDHCDLVITLDNQPPVLQLDIPAVVNACGVIPWTPTLALQFNVSASQPNGRLYNWTLQYTKGVNPTVYTLAGNSSSSGALSVSNVPVSGAALLVGLASTCAFALKLHAWAHIRNGYGFVYDAEQIKAIAIEKCEPCAKCQDTVVN